jgi:hypothetical protein
MIIVSDKIRNLTVKFGKERVEFDKFGKAKVSEEIGKKVIFDHPDYYEEGKKQVKEIQKDIINDVTDEKVLAKFNELETQLLVSSQKLEKAIGDLNISKEEVENWKAEYEKVKQSVEGKTIVESFEEVNIPQLQENDINVIVDLCSKSKKDLLDLCEGLGLLKAEYQELNQKQLVVYIGKKTLYAPKTE